MKKLINGIKEFRKNSLLDYRKKFASLSDRAGADALFIACCDSRVVPNTFASTDPGDLFVLRNIGNLIEPYGTDDTDTDDSTRAAVEFSLQYLKVKDIIVCGHSECIAIKSIVDNKENTFPPHLKNWLRHGKGAFDKFNNGFRLHTGHNIYNEVSQINVLQQLEHLRTYPLVQEALKKQQINLHGWWFELATANVYDYKEMEATFSLIE